MEPTIKVYEEWYVVQRLLSQNDHENVLTCQIQLITKMYVLVYSMYRKCKKLFLLTLILCFIFIFDMFNK
jgi:hypothetical protein